MAHQDDAGYFDDHKDDFEEWGEPLPERVQPSPRLASMVSVRFAPDEVVEIRAAADRAGRSLSDFVRQAALSCVRHKVEFITSVQIGVPEAVWTDPVRSLHSFTGRLGSMPVTTTTR